MGAWPGWGALRKLDDFPASHESGAHGLVLLFKANSWNITHLLISMQKHLRCQTVSPGVTSTDPPGSLLFIMGGVGEQRRPGVRFRRAPRATVRSSGLEQREVISECKAVTGSDLDTRFEKVFLSAGRRRDWRGRAEEGTWSLGLCCPPALWAEGSGDEALQPPGARGAEGKQTNKSKHSKK